MESDSTVFCLGGKATVEVKTKFPSNMFVANAVVMSFTHALKRQSFGPFNIGIAAETGVCCAALYDSKQGILYLQINSL